MVCLLHTPRYPVVPENDKQDTFTRHAIIVTLICIAPCPCQPVWRNEPRTFCLSRSVLDSKPRLSHGYTNIHTIFVSKTRGNPIIPHDITLCGTMKSVRLPLLSLSTSEFWSYEASKTRRGSSHHIQRAFVF
jgi:hypothetical protein